MKVTLHALSFGILGLFVGAGCVADDADDADVSSTESAIKGTHKAFVGKRLENKVSVYDEDGAFLGDMTGAGLSLPFGIHVEDEDVYVVSQASNSVFAHIHHHGEGATEQLQLVELVPPTAGLATPFYPTVRRGVLYVSSGGTNEVLRFDAKTGASRGVFVAPGDGLSQPRGVDFDSDGNLYVSSYLSDQVKVYDRHGAFVKDLATITSPCGVTINDDDVICVGSAAAPGIGGLSCYLPDGTQVYAGPTEGPVCGVDWGPDGRVYPTRPNINIVQAHDIETGEIETFVSAPDSPGPSNIAGVSWGVPERDCGDGHGPGGHGGHGHGHGGHGGGYDDHGHGGGGHGHGGGGHGHGGHGHH